MHTSWILQMSFTCRNNGCQSKNNIDARHPHIQKTECVQIIKCNPWSTRLHPHPSLIKKMRTYLKLEGKVGLKPRQQPNPQQNKNQLRPIQPRTNPLVKRGTKTNDKGRNLIPTRWYKV